MPNDVPRTTLDARYSERDAQPTSWPDAVIHLERAGLFWVSSVRADGRPHVTPVVAVWTDGALYFTSGPSEQKSRNLAVNRHCAVTTGCNTWNEGLDVVLEGDAVRVHDLSVLRQVADAFLAKYGQDWAFEVAEDGTFKGPSLVYQLVPVKGLAFGKSPFSHTRWDFDRGAPAP
jgi:hypothetical protein